MADSQSVPTAPMVAEGVGYDGGKQIKGRKRHIIVDSLGLLLAVVVSAANGADGDGLKQLIKRAQRWVNLKRLVRILVDGGYRGTALADWVMRQGPWLLEVVMRSPEVKGFKLLPQRWVVERTFGWLRWCRRLNRDYELKTTSAEAWIYLASIRIMLRRLA